MSSVDLHPGGPRVVALGGGHGTAVTLRAARRYAADVTAIVSVADDGGSSGRLRQQYDVVALGDIRKCLVALAESTSLLAKSMEHRFEVGVAGGFASRSSVVPHPEEVLAHKGSGGDLAGHALGNLLLAGLIETTGDLVSGVDAVAELLHAVGRVLPATTEKVSLKAEADQGEVSGQVAVSAAGRIHKVSLVPGGSSPPKEAVDAILAADQIVIGPGSLYTSVIAAAVVPGIPEALAASSAQKVYVSNLYPQTPETEGYLVADHVVALREHGVRFDVVLWDQSAGLGPGHIEVRAVNRVLCESNRFVHDPARLAGALFGLLREQTWRSLGHTSSEIPGTHLPPPPPL